MIWNRKEQCWQFFRLPYWAARLKYSKSCFFSRNFASLQVKGLPGLYRKHIFEVNLSILFSLYIHIHIYIYTYIYIYMYVLNKVRYVGASWGWGDVSRSLASFACAYVLPVMLIVAPFWQASPSLQTMKPAILNPVGIYSPGNPP